MEVGCLSGIRPRSRTQRTAMRCASYREIDEFKRGRYCKAIDLRFINNH